MRFLTTFFLLSFLANLSLSQNIIPPFGSVTEAWFEENPYSTDSSVHAYVIWQKTDVRLELTPSGSFYRRTNIRRIVRVLDPLGYDQGTFRLRVFDAGVGSDPYELGELKGATYNKGGDKSIVKKEDVYKSKLTSNLAEISFSFPNIKAGSILDFELELISYSNTYIPDAVMQEEIPILNIEHQFRAHEYFKFKTTPHGYFPIKMVRSEEKTRNVRVSGKDRLITLTANNVPALKREPYISSLSNYAAHHKFELLSVYVPGYESTDLSGSWAKIVGNIRSNRNLTEAIKGKGYYKEWAAKLPENKNTDTEKAAWALAEVNNLINWNGYDSCWPENKAAKAVEKREGDSGDINTLLLGLNNAIGLKSYPVFSSTIDNGWLIDFIPLQTSLNTIIVATEIDGKITYEDASQDKSILGILPNRSLNGKGILVKNGEFKFVDLHDGALKQRSLQAKMILDEKGYLSGDVTLILKGQSVLDYIHQEDEEWLIDLTPLNLDETYEILERTNIKEGEGTHIVKLKIKSYSPLPDLGGSFALDPCLLKFQSENPFSLSTRSYPIEFKTRLVDTREISIKLPTGLKLENLPKPTFATTSNKKAIYRHILKETETGIQLTTLFAVKELVFLPEVYPEVQGLFSVIEEKESSLYSVDKLP